VTRIQPGILIGGAWYRVASVANAVHAFKATEIFPLDQNAIPDHFSICNAAQRGEAIEPDCSDLINNSPELSS
jgi:hypothetical protein